MNGHVLCDMDRFMQHVMIRLKSMPQAKCTLEMEIIKVISDSVICIRIELTCMFQNAYMLYQVLLIMLAAGSVT
jgi:hypothetical protein